MLYGDGSALQEKDCGGLPEGGPLVQYQEKFYRRGETGGNRKPALLRLTEGVKRRRRWSGEPDIREWSCKMRVIIPWFFLRCRRFIGHSGSRIVSFTAGKTWRILRGITKNTRKCSQKPIKLCNIDKNAVERCIRLSIDNKNRAVYNSEYIRNDEDIRNKEYTPSRGARKTGAYFFIRNRLIILMIVI